MPKNEENGEKYFHDSEVLIIGIFVTLHWKPAQPPFNSAQHFYRFEKWENGKRASELTDDLNRSTYAATAEGNVKGAILSGHCYGFEVCFQT